MSIVEAALNKAKLQPAQTPVEEARERVAPVPSLVERPREAAASSPVVANHRVSVDFESLKVAGMLPPRELAQRYAEEFRRVKWPLLAAAAGNGAARAERGNLLLVTSSAPGEGKSFVSLNLSLSISSGDHPVLLVDGDPAKGRISRLFGVQDRPGFVDLLRDSSLELGDVLVDTDVPGLQLIPAGRAHLQSAELFSSRRAEAIIGQLGVQDAARIVIVDSAPLLATNEAQVLSRHMGQVLFVVRADMTPVAAVREAAALIDPNRVVRAVLNQVRVGPLGDINENYYYAYGSER